MGIDNFTKLVNKNASDAVSKKKIEDYKGKILGIDASLMLYKVVLAIRGMGYDLKKNGIITTHIHGFLSKLTVFKRYNINAVFVFDGAPPELKNETLKERTKRREDNKNKYKDAKTEDEKKKYYLAKEDISNKEFSDIKKLIQLFGFTTIDAIEEADSQLGYMSKNGMIDAVITDDPDILIFGAKKILKNFSIDKRKVILEINRDKLLKKLNITTDQFIDLGIILGCDYCPTFDNIGVVRGYKYILEYKTLKNIDKEKNIKLLPCHLKTQKYFKKPKIIKNVNIQENHLNEKGLKSFLKKFNYTSEDVNKIIQKINMAL